MKLVPLVLCVATATSSLALAEPVGSEVRPVTAFHAISLSGGLKATVRQGATPQLMLVGEDSQRARYVSEVKDGVLVIRRDSQPWASRRGKPVVALITVTSLDAVSASGGVEVTIESGVGPVLSVDMSGGVDLRAAGLSLERLVLDVSGGAEVALAGSAGSVDADFSGGVQADLAGLVARTLELDASGGCSVEARVTESVTGDLSGGVDLVLHGRPTTVKLDKSAGASVRYTST